MFGKKRKNAGKETVQENFEDAKVILEKRTHENKRAVKKELKELLDSTKSYQEKRIELAESSARTWKKMAFAGMGIGLAGVMAVAAIAPFKTAVPYLLRYNSETGYTDLAPVYKNNKATINEAVDKYFLSQFVMYHEGYDWQTIQNNVDSVKLLSNDKVFTEYDAYIRSKNSPVRILGENARVKVLVISVTFLGDVAQVRYRKTILNSKGEPDVGYTPMNYVATISYDYQKRITFDKERINVNPLGFQALSWNTTPENVEAVAQ